MKERLPLAILIGVIVALTSWDWIFGLESWMTVPVEVRAAFEEVKQGEFTGGSFAELATLLGCAFLHGDIGHLLGNLLYLWIFGAVVLEICGWRWMLFIFLSTAIGGSIGHVVLEPSSAIPMLGASGAVMGFEGAYFGLVVRKPRPDPHVWPMAHAIPPGHLAAIGVFYVVMDLGNIFGGVDAGVAYGAHVGGFATGILVSLLRKD